MERDGTWFAVGVDDQVGGAAVASAAQPSVNQFGGRSGTVVGDWSSAVGYGLSFDRSFRSDRGLATQVST